jgi:amidohydrolase
MKTPENLISIRRELHAHPGKSGDEKQTQERIQRFLLQNLNRIGQNVGQFGTLIDFDFGQGPCVLVRVDIDALPIQEINTFEHRSKIDGVSHKCGHDGHSTIGLGLAALLKEKPLTRGKVSILFQPAEETGEGAIGVLNDVNFNVSDFDMAIALHNIPGVPMHQILYKTEAFTPAVQSLIVKLEGKTSHAAQPLKGFNPSYAIAQIIDFAKSTEQTDENHEAYHLLTPVYINVGTKDYGISAGYGEIHFTIRSWTQEKMLDATDKLKSFVSEVASLNHLKVSFELTAKFASNKNHPDIVNHITTAAEQLGLDTQLKEVPFPWGEDFGIFTQKIPGAMFGLGAGIDTPALHNPDYDFPDEITQTGIELFYQALKNIMDDV